MTRAAIKRTAMMMLAFALVISMYASLEAKPVFAESHVDNPFTGATNYVNPDYSTLVDQSIAQTTDPSLIAKMLTVRNYPTSVWLDRISAITAPGGRSLTAHLDAALAQKQPGVPITASFVVYDLPGRDCAAQASAGELTLDAAGLNQYKTQFIDPIAAAFANPKYQDIRIVVLLEPDSLPNLVTNLSDPECAAAKNNGVYVSAIQYALNQLSAIPNVYTYMDIGHSGWLGWDNNLNGVVDIYTSTVAGTTNGFNSINGFVTNTSNYTPVEEPFLPNPNLSVGGTALKTVDFYGWNSRFDESDFTASLYNAFMAKVYNGTHPWPSTIGFLIDTSRNGWGGANRPAAVSTSTNATTYVNQSKIDRRQHRGLWCNLSGAGLGYAPQAEPAGFSASHLDAFVWNKPPGQSDGSSVDIPNNEGKMFDPNCDPNYQTNNTVGGVKVLSGAMPDAPLAGQWFHNQFVMLIQNAYPAIPESPVLTVTEALGEKANLQWRSPGANFKYDVFYQDAGVWKTLVANYTGTSYQTSYYLVSGKIKDVPFKVIAKSTTNASDVRSSNIAKPDPLHFWMNVSYNGGTYPKITWSNLNASYYTIGRSTDNVNWTNPVGNYADVSTGFLDTTAQPNTVYYYRICASDPSRNATCFDPATVYNWGTSLENGQLQPTWNDTTEVKTNVTGYTSAINPEASVRVNELSHSGSSALIYSGTDGGGLKAYAYFKSFDVNIPVTADTQLSYWFLPQNDYARNFSVIVITTDGTRSDLAGTLQTDGSSIYASAPRGTVNQWTRIQQDVGKTLKGKTIDRILLAYHHQDSTNRPAGQFRGYVDDLQITSSKN